MKLILLTVFKITLAIMTVLALSGCSPGQHRWEKSAVPQSQSQKDLAICTYQAESATATLGTGGHPKSTSDAIGNGIADGIESGMEQSELISRCMQAQGYQ